MIGSYSTTQETAGFSISILVPDELMLKYWLDTHKAPDFPIII